MLKYYKKRFDLVGQFHFIFNIFYEYFLLVNDKSLFRA